MKTASVTCTYCGWTGGHARSCPVIRNPMQPAAELLPTESRAEKRLDAAVAYGGDFLSRLAASFIGTFLAGSLIVLLCYTYLQWRITAEVEHFQKVTLPMIQKNGNQFMDDTTKNMKKVHDDVEADLSKIGKQPLQKKGK